MEIRYVSIALLNNNAQQILFQVSIPLMPLKDRTSPDQLSEASLPASTSSPSKEVGKLINNISK